MNHAAMRANAMSGLGTTLRRGTVESYNPQTGTVKCMIQPDGVLTGWCPVLTAWVGQGWGLIAPPPIGTAVLLASEDGDPRSLVVVGAYFSEVDTPPPAPPGELWLVHETGAFIKLTNAGEISINAPAGGVSITGTVTVTGDVVANGISLTKHTHPTPSGESGAPTG